ncbi:MAG TPA: hypothetical protein VFM29_07070 [Vicinamibacteria bacterium]|nr:hypothetical protein [Vicinamibacteria bacterium]
MAARMDVPVIGTKGTPYPREKGWQVSTGYRWQRSHRHFVGSEEQHERAEDSSEVVNNIHLVDVTTRYQATRRISLSVGVPYFMATRSFPIRNAAREVIDRSLTQARGPGDLAFSARRWMMDPDRCANGNVSLGLGFKLPTGEASALDVRRRFSNGAIVSTIEPVDQSIQPGDGGFGITAEAAGFRRLGGRVLGYASATYLLNPQETNHTFRGGTNPITRYMSVADQYLVRAGMARSFGSWTGSLGGRLEGVPSEDLLGGSNGFRRPGYAASVEPGLSYTRGQYSVSLGVPFAVYRNRTRSVSDKANGGHGDAAFADYLVLVGVSRSF